jgi:hypothetical protein
MFGGKKNYLKKKVEVNNILCHHNSSRMREVIISGFQQDYCKIWEITKIFLKLKKNIIIFNFFEKIFHDPHSNTQYL